MTFTHALSTNNYGTSKFIVATSAANGTHTTLASAMAAASAGDTIFLRDSVTENVTLTPGVNIVGPGGEISSNQPTIIGTLTMTGAGTCLIQNVALQTNSNFLIAVTGSAASILNVSNCYLNCSNNTGISHTSSSNSSAINIYDSIANIGTTGITLVVSTSQGFISHFNTYVGNSGGSTTASTTSGGGAGGGIGADNSFFQIPFATSSTGSLIMGYSTISLTNTTAVTTAGTSSTNEFRWCTFSTGSASAVSIGSGTTCELINNRIVSDNTNAVTGAGTLRLGPNTFPGASSTINTSTIQNESEVAGNLRLNGSLTFGTGSPLSTYTAYTGWTPGIAFGGSATGITYANQFGQYWRVGGVVYFTGVITLSSKGAQVGAATLTGLPITSKNDGTATCYITISQANNITFTATYVSAYLLTQSNSTTATVNQWSPTLGNLQFTDVQFANNTDLRFTGFYFVDG